LWPLLDDRIRLLKYGTRTALPRHRTLTAALDWSYEFLPEDERALLRRLSVFSCFITLESAAAVAADASFDVVEGVANLVAKSLVFADVGKAGVDYRLLETPRAYAMQKLSASGELQDYVRRHAEHHRDLLERAEAEWEARPTAEWLEEYGRRIDDVRSALKWAFSPSGDASTGVALTVASIPLSTQLSLMDECRECVERAQHSQRRRPRKPYGRAEPQRTRRDEAPGRTRNSAAECESSAARDRRCLDEGPPARGKARRKRVSVAGDVGTVGLPRVCRRLSRGACSCGTVLCRRPQEWRRCPPADRRLSDRDGGALPGRSRQRAASP